MGLHRFKRIVYNIFSKNESIDHSILYLCSRQYNTDDQNFNHRPSQFQFPEIPGIPGRHAPPLPTEGFPPKNPPKANLKFILNAALSATSRGGTISALSSASVVWIALSQARCVLQAVCNREVLLLTLLVYLII